MLLAEGVKDRNFQSFALFLPSSRLLRIRHKTKYFIICRLQNENIDQNKSKLLPAHCAAIEGCVTAYCYLDLVVLGKLTAKYSSIVICKENHGTVVPPKREKKSKVTNAMH